LQADPGGAAAPVPQGAGAPVAKTAPAAAPGPISAGPSITSGSFDDPASLLAPSQDPFAVPPEAAPSGDSATGEAIPAPKRNPKR
jgi:hypothetical protein